MTTPDAVLLDAPPIDDKPTDYDWAHRICYLRLLDADAEGADWREVARLILHLEPDREEERVRGIWQRHLDRAKWMTTHGYREYLS